jgi:hypothetical protein
MPPASKFASTGTLFAAQATIIAKQMTMAPPSEDELKAIADDLEANPGKARAMIHSYIMSDSHFLPNVPPAVGSSWMKCAHAAIQSAYGFNPTVKGGSHQRINKAFNIPKNEFMAVHKCPTIWLSPSGSGAPGGLRAAGQRV